MESLEARRHVLHTTELLEAILLQVDLQTLLTSAQLVCKRWHDLITYSRTLQQALFFQPAPPHTQRVQNPLLAKFFPLWFPDPEGPRQNFCHADLQTLPLAGKEHRDAFLRKGASWRHMLVQQPPAQSLGYIEIIQGFGGISFNRYFLPFDQGVRMNAFYDLALFPLGRLKRDHKVSCLWWEGSKEAQTAAMELSSRAKAQGDASRLSDIVIETWESNAWDDDDGLGIYADPWKSTRTFEFPMKDWRMSASRRDLKPEDQGTIDPEMEDDNGVAAAAAAAPVAAGN